MSGTVAVPEGITNPPIDELLEAADSKYGLVIYAAKRARQINAYYSQLGEGLLEYVGPLVETHVQEKPLSIALREINAGLLTAEPSSRVRGLTAPMARSAPRVVLGVGGGIAAYKACELLRLLTETGHDVRVVPTAAALRVRRRAHLGGAVRPAGDHRGLGRRRTRCRTSRLGQRGRPGRRRARPPPTCWPGPRTAWPTTCSPTPCSPPAARWCSPRRCTPRCGSTRPPGPTSPRCARAACVVLEPGVGRLTGADTGPGRLPEPERDLRRRAPALLRPRRVAGRRPGRPAASWSSAGGTREPLDPVRFLGNRSSGRQGYALAATAAARGAEVTLVAANVALPDPAGVDGRPGRHRRGAAHGVLAAAADADVVVMAAAVADFRPADVRRQQDQEDRRPADAPTAASWCATRTSWPSSCASARAPGQVRRRLRRRDRRRRRRRAGPRPGQAGPQGLRPARGQRGRRRARPSGRPTTPRSSSAPTAASPRGPSTAQGRRRRRGLGRGRGPAPAAGSRTTGPTPGCVTDVGPTSQPAADHATPRSRRVPAACSPPSPSPRATRTRSPTRSATRSSTRCSRRTRAAGSPSRR